MALESDHSKPIYPHNHAGNRTDRHCPPSDSPAFDLDEALCCPIIDSPTMQPGMRTGREVLPCESSSFDLGDALCCPFITEEDVESRNFRTPEILVSGMPTVSGGGICAVCMEEIGNGSTCGKRLPCSHVYHQGCILQWLARDSSCPLCRCCVRPE